MRYNMLIIQFKLHRRKLPHSINRSTLQKCFSIANMSTAITDPSNWQSNRRIQTTWFKQRAITQNTEDEWTCTRTDMSRVAYPIHLTFPTNITFPWKLSHTGDNQVATQLTTRNHTKPLFIRHLYIIQLHALILAREPRTAKPLET